MRAESGLELVLIYGRSFEQVSERYVERSMEKIGQRYEFHLGSL